MGPNTLFDKSFLQSLSIDESVWFDHFFTANICPLFYVETLADLEKEARECWVPEEEVGLIAEKFPEMHGGPNIHHSHLALGELLGHSVAMTGQIILAGGRMVREGGKTGVVFEDSPEAQAFSRWQKHEFWLIERLYAKAWRQALSMLDLNELRQSFGRLGFDAKTCKSLEDAKNLAESAVRAREKPFDRMKLAILFLNIPRHLHQDILKRFSILNYPPLADFAPYTAHVITIELFFQIALSANLISGDRSSNRVDIAYLFYLPFSRMFVSSDRLHKRCAPLFLRNDQSFVWGLDLKEDLKKINNYYAEFPVEIRKKGVMSFAGYPPKEGDFFVARLWDHHFPGWREKKEIDISDKPTINAKLGEEIRKMADAPSLSSDEINFDPTKTDTLTVKRSIRKSKGSWLQIPEDIDKKGKQ